MSESKIKRILLDLEKEGYIESSNKYNDNPYNKTKWYTVTDKLSSVKKETIDSSNMDDRREENGQSYISTDINTDINTDKEKINKKENRNKYERLEKFMLDWNDQIQYDRNWKTTRKITPEIKKYYDKILKQYTHEDLLYSANKYLEEIAGRKKRND